VIAGPVVRSSGRPVVLLLLGILSLAAADVSIAIRSAVVVAAPVATVADVADLTGDAAQVAKLGALPVQDLFGSARFLIDEARIRQAIGTSAAGTTLAISGSGYVVAPVRTWSVENLAEAARATLSSGGDEVEATMLRASGALTVPDFGPGGTLVAEPIDRTQASGEMPFRVRAVHHGRELGRALVSLSVRRYRSMAVAAMPVKAGQVLGPADLRLERREVLRHTQAAATTAEACLGRVVGRDHAEGEPLLTTALSAPFAVTAGRNVDLVWRKDGLELITTGLSLASARHGEVIQVRRTTDGQLVRAVVVGDNQAQINY
jgi:flagella basal body P-ring formation protein FlgA